jgi:hypothetical protein
MYFVMSFLDWPITPVMLLCSSSICEKSKCVGEMCIIGIVANPGCFWKLDLDPDPHCSEKLDPDPH